ncbi:hypothetical protein ACKKBF_B21525 [Auxenochlorella protothecoides x Auxenochlorella symbiontica]|uniref:Uncharacterized protein n=1 Tax=Auxenochlorella protothecoides TaxID=3075 RepID=A0A1D2A1S3_AUXPR|nr:hypothetical protein APUTEX25_002230 [Auxenochlorella protothecoides]|eukprot:RMZ55372.1 hypothetical protein APUTEX25_002230 [Auxenochlorella protothecoides]
MERRASFPAPASFDSPRIEGGAPRVVGFEQPSPSSVCRSLEIQHHALNMAERAAVHSTLGKALTEQPRAAPLGLRVKTRPVPLGKKTVSIAQGAGGAGSPVEALMEQRERTPSSTEREQLSRASSGSIDIPIPTRLLRAHTAPAPHPQISEDLVAAMASMVQKELPLVQCATPELRQTPPSAHPPTLPSGAAAAWARHRRQPSFEGELRAAHAEAVHAHAQMAALASALRREQKQSAALRQQLAALRAERRRSATLAPPAGPEPEEAEEQPGTARRLSPPSPVPMVSAFASNAGRDWEAAS